MWVANKSITLSVMAITGSQNKILFMKLQKEIFNIVITEHTCSQWFKLTIGPLMDCIMIFPKKKSFMMTQKFIDITILSGTQYSLHNQLHGCSCVSSIYVVDQGNKPIYQSMIPHVNFKIRTESQTKA